MRTVLLVGAIAMTGCGGGGGGNVRPDPEVAVVPVVQETDPEPSAPPEDPAPVEDPVPTEPTPVEDPAPSDPVIDAPAVERTGWDRAMHEAATTPPVQGSIVQSGSDTPGGPSFFVPGMIEDLERSQLIIFPPGDERVKEDHLAQHSREGRNIFSYDLECVTSNRSRCGIVPQGSMGAHDGRHMLQIGSVEDGYLLHVARWWSLQAAIAARDPMDEVLPGTYDDPGGNLLRARWFDYTNGEVGMGWFGDRLDDAPPVESLSATANGEFLGMASDAEDNFYEAYGTSMYQMEIGTEGSTVTLHIGMDGNGHRWFNYWPLGENADVRDIPYIFVYEETMGADNPYFGIGEHDGINDVKKVIPWPEQAIPVGSVEGQFGGVIISPRGSITEPVVGGEHRQVWYGEVVGTAGLTGLDEILGDGHPAGLSFILAPYGLYEVPEN